MSGSFPELSHWPSGDFLRGLCLVEVLFDVLSAATLIAGAPAVLAQGAPGKTSGLQHKVSKKHHPSGYAPRREMQAKGSKRGYPGAFGYAPAEPSGFDRELEMSRQAGGGGGGGGGSGM